MHRFRLFLPLCGLVGLLPAQILPNRYIVELADAPAGVVQAQLARRSPGSRMLDLSQSAEVRTRRAAIQASQQRVARAIQSRGGRVLDAVDTTLNALVVEMNSTTAQRLAELPGVVRVVPDRMTWARLDRVLALSNVPQAWEKMGGASKAGAGRGVAILDTGIDTGHPGFKDDSLTPPPGYPKASSAANEKLTTSKVVVVRSYESMDPGAGYGVDGSDNNGHGTNAACASACVVHETPIGMIAGAAPKAFLGSYKVLGDNGGGPNSVILKGIDDAVKDGFDVLNLSLGSDVAGDPANDMQVKAVNQAVEAGAVVAVAAGNAGPDENTMNSPGTAEKAITVGSSSSDREVSDAGRTAIDPNRLSSFSSRGPNPGAGLKPDMVAVGDNFYTATTRLPNPDVYYKVTQGTSFATPTVAGAAATLMTARPGLTEPQYRSLLINSSSEIRLAEGPAPIRHQGAGRLDLLAAMDSPVAFAPTSVQWGIGGASADASREIVVTNLTDATVNVEMGVKGFDGKVAAVIDGSDRLTLAPKGTGTVRLKFSGSGLSGEFHGVLLAKNSVNGVESRIPYWYGVRSQEAKGITLLEAKSEGKAGESVILFVRVVDGSGIEIPGAKVDVVAEAGGSVEAMETHPESPSVTLVQVKLAAGENTFVVSSGGATRKVVLTGN